MTTEPGASWSTLLVDDDERYLSFLTRYLCRTYPVRIVGTATCGERAVLLAAHHRPHLVLLDWRLPDGAGIDLVPDLRRTAPDVRILMTTTLEPAYRDLALARGADGFVHKMQLERDLPVELARVMGSGVAPS